ncbi:hypothetical protein ABT072_12480 [Streptomyces sp. NPDC002589]|uniref:hypothetical protein n=1 Tax=Streptomyces sp. NPDC002589 TaxID=3154420 RepID=UPI003329ADC1
MPGGDDAEDREAALAALREKLRYALGPLNKAGLGFLARSLQRHGQPESLDRLARRAITTASSLTGSSFLGLLQVFRAHGWTHYAQALTEQAAEHLALADAATRRKLLINLRTAGETETAERLEAMAPLSRPSPPAPDAKPASPPAPPRAYNPYGLKTDGAPARPWSWRDLDHPRTSLPNASHRPPQVRAAPAPWPAWERYADN